MQSLKNKNLKNSEILNNIFNGIKDSYLAYDEKMTPLQKKYKEIFDNFFQESSIKPPKEKISLKSKITKWVYKKIFKINLPEFESKYVELKPNRGENCTFMQADIMDIDKIVTDKKADIILFKNALYHLITNDIGKNLFRTLKPDAEEILNKLVLKFRNTLSENGIVCFGEDESLQLLDTTLVSKIMKQNGFKPIIISKDIEPNIWQKI